MWELRILLIWTHKLFKLFLWETLIWSLTHYNVHAIHRVPVISTPIEAQTSTWNLLQCLRDSSEPSEQSERPSHICLFVISIHWLSSHLWNPSAHVRAAEIKPNPFKAAEKQKSSIIWCRGSSSDQLFEVRFQNIGRNLVMDALKVVKTDKISKNILPEQFWD